MVLQALLVLISKAPPKKCRLMILATSSNQEFLNQVGMVGLFTRVIHIPRINTIDQIIKVLEECDFTQGETEQISNLLHRSGFNFHIGIKQLLKLVENAKQCDVGERAGQLVNALEEIALDSRDFRETIQ